MPFSCLLVTLKNVFSHENFFWKNDLRSEAEKATNREQEAKKANVTKCKTFKTGRL